MANLKAFPKLMVMECFSKALRRAANVMAAEVRVRIPYNDQSRTATSVKEYGLLLNDLISLVTIDANGNGGKAQITFNKKGMVALWVEYGHRMVTGGRYNRRGSRQVGNVPPHPFMRPAFEAAAEETIAAFIEEVENYVNADVRMAA